MNLEGKAAIVTGAGTGVGQQTAIRLAEQGCSVLVNYQNSREGAEQTATECEKRGVKALAVRADVSQDREVRELVERTVDAFGSLHVLVNNAATTAFVEEVRKRELLGSKEVKLDVPSGQSQVLTGLRIIEEEKFNALPDEVFLE